MNRILIKNNKIGPMKSTKNFYHALMIKYIALAMDMMD